MSTKRRMKRLREKGYAELDTDERFQLFIRYQARGDDDEAEKLFKAAPRKRWEITGAELSDRLRDVKLWTSTIVLELRAANEAFNVLDAFIRPTMNQDVADDDLPGGLTAEFLPESLVDLLRGRERDVAGEAHYEGVKAGVEWAGGDPDAIDWEAPDAPRAPEPGDHGYRMPPIDLLENLLETAKVGKAQKLLAEWSIAQEVCRDRWGVELETLIRGMGRSEAMLEVVDRARTILDEYENEDDLLDDDPDLPEWREILETMPE